MGPFRTHVFVCTSGSVCPVDTDSKAVHARLKELVKAAGLSDTIRINHSGCLDQCGNGPMIAVYPEDVWYCHVSVADAEEIFSEHLVGGKPVARLLYHPAKPGANKLKKAGTGEGVPDITALATPLNMSMKDRMTHLKRTPLHVLEVEQGAVLEPYAEWEIAIQFGDAREEYDAVVRSAGVLDVSYVGKLRLTGRDRVRFLNNMLSNDIKALRPGQGCYATLLTHQGRMESDAYVYVADEEIWLEASPAGTERLQQSLKRFIVSDDVTVEDCTDRIAILSLQGPGSAAVADRTVGFALNGLGPLEHRRVGPGPQPWTVVRRDRTGCDGFDFWLPASDAGALWRRLVRQERTRPVGHEALNRLRTEAGIPWFGVDMDDRSLPMEMGLTAAISFSKGCYRGQEIVARVTHRGHLDRGFGGVAVDRSQAPKPGAEILHLGSRVGEVTSAVVSPALGSALALAVLKRECLQPGIQVEVVDGDSRAPGRVVTLPIPRG